MPLTIETCPVCECGISNVHFKKLRRCSQCRFIYADPSEYENLDPTVLYDHHYFSGGEYHDYASDERLTKKNLRRRMTELGSGYLTPDSQVLEIGCAYGYFLEILQEYGCRMTGIDVSSSAIDEAKKKSNDVWVTTVEAFETDKMYSHIFMWDTIEHVTNCDTTIQRVSRLLADGGEVVFTTGDIGSVNARVRRSKWRMIHPPTHLSYFDRNTIQILLERHGLAVQEIWSVGMYRSVGLLFNFMSLVQRTDFLRRMVSKWSTLQRLSFYVNLGDVMCVRAKKTGTCR